MNNKLKAILDSLPRKRQRSKLEPYADLIEELRRRGRTFREIAHILAKSCDLIVMSSTVVRFVASRSKTKRKYSKPETGSVPMKKLRTTIPKTVPDPASSDALEQVRKRIEVLKQRPDQNIAPARQFEYDPNQPLRIGSAAKKKNPGNNT